MNMKKVGHREHREDTEVTEKNEKIFSNLCVLSDFSASSVTKKEVAA